MDKVVHSLREAIGLAGVKSGMTVSFHHHMRNGDFVLNMVMEELAQMGVKNLTVNASSVFDCHRPLIDHIRSGVVTKLSPMGGDYLIEINFEGIGTKKLMLRAAAQHMTKE